jgi:S-adenosylmethionine hydrolase
MAIITLTTDYGMSDGYVGSLKGVIASLAPEARVIDIAHDIPRGDIAHAAWVIASSTHEFPYGSIHVVVVDPGVGGARNEVIIRGDGQWFIGPDNGVFTYVMRPEWDAWAIEDAGLRAKHVSKTFRGRDVFARAAAMIARDHGGLTAPPQRGYGTPVKLLGTLPWGSRSRGSGRIVHVDRFGNLVSDLPPAEAGRSVTIVGQTLAVVGTYEDVAPGQLLAYVGSAATIEIAVREGRADTRLSVERGALVLPAGGSTPYR